MTRETTDTPAMRIREARKQVSIAIELLEDDAQSASELATVLAALEQVFDDLDGEGELDQLFAGLDGEGAESSPSTEEHR